MSSGSFLAVRLPNEQLFGTEEALKDELWRLVRQDRERPTRPLLNELAETLGNEDIAYSACPDQWTTLIDAVLDSIVSLAFGHEAGTQIYNMYDIPHVFVGDPDEDYIDDNMRYAAALEAFLGPEGWPSVAQNVDYDSLTAEEMRAYLKHHRLGEGVVAFVMRENRRKEP